MFIVKLRIDKRLHKYFIVAKIVSHWKTVSYVTNVTYVVWLVIWRMQARSSSRCCPHPHLTRSRCCTVVRACRTWHWTGTAMDSVRTRMVTSMRTLLNVTTIWSKVEIFRIILKVILFKEMPQLLSWGKLDSTRTVDVNIPSASLLAMLSLFYSNLFEEDSDEITEI